jgi:pimeloyl-ACP methyl ester carboxylesterase
VLLLHGFPDFWYVWREQIPALARGGFRVVAPDLRGYNRSGKPRGVGSYSVAVLARDVERLVRHCGASRAAVVGHDFGGAAGWLFAMRQPAMLDRLAVLNAPHPLRFARAALDPRQGVRSWYMLLFQLPWLPERLLRAGEFAALRWLLRSSPGHGGPGPAQMQRYLEAWRQPGALTGALNHYRALLRSGPLDLRRALRRIDAPVLVVWGERDRFARPELAEPDRAWVPRARVHRLPDAGHWVQLDRPTRVNALLLSFLGAPAARDAAPPGSRADPRPGATSSRPSERGSI